ncbi:hypothetical protein EDB92DRAFT_318709 [Lactarius akahatsu]|uniref:Transmembrane protein n=1 Tax=Lactarius akahatsu TaxID=416441 RepID=A0AAD4LMZ6_9AGAM|nr:hypothetical protein EDB92DRAFT_318709 [Lactarius akahatsu]
MGVISFDALMRYELQQGKAKWQGGSRSVGGKYRGAAWRVGRTKTDLYVDLSLGLRVAATCPELTLGQGRPCRRELISRAFSLFFCVFFFFFFSSSLLHPPLLLGLYMRHSASRISVTSRLRGVESGRPIVSRSDLRTLLKRASFFFSFPFIVLSFVLPLPQSANSSSVIVAGSVGGK